MHTQRVGDFPANFILSKINNHNLGRVRDVKFSRGGIDAQIIPTAFTADWNVLQEFVTALSFRRVYRRGER